MPQERTLADSILTPAYKEREFKIVPGREIYNEMSLTAINRSVIESLTAFITGEASLDKKGGTMWPEIPPDDMCNYFLVDGSFALRFISDAEMAKNEKLDHQYEFLKDLVEVHRRLVVQKGRDKEGKLTDEMRVWQMTAKDWVVRDIKNYGQEGEQVMATNRYPLDAFLPYPNHQGILFWNQYTYRRIEEIEQSIRTQTGKASLSIILTGYMGDIKQARDAFANPGEVIHLPGNPTVTKVTSTGTVDQLTSNGDKFMRLFLKNTHQIEISETANISGVARRLAMTPMLHYIKLVQRQITEVYEKLGYEIGLHGLRITTPEERAAELDFLDRGLREKHLDPDQYETMARSLYN